MPKHFAHNFLKNKVVCTLLILSSVSFPLSTFAADSPAPPSTATRPVAGEPALKPIPKDKLWQLGVQFMKQVGGNLEEANLMMTGAGKVELAERKSGTVLGEEEPLLMQGVLNTFKITFKQDIYTIKKNKKLYISLGEFCNAADLPIVVNPTEGTAEGWFIREDQRLNLDVKKQQVTLLGKTTPLNPDDILQTDTDLLVSSALLEKWFGISFDYDFAALRLKIRTTQPFPAETRYARSLFKAGNDFNVGPAKLPLQEEPYRIASLPYINTNMNLGRYKETKSSPAFVAAGWSSIISGDLLGHSMEGYVSGNRNDPLNQARITLSKRDSEGTLLGPLKATGYSFGDVAVVPVDLIDRGGQEQGINASNLPLDVTDQTSTDIRGTAQPDWDVELYQNDNLVDVRRIDGTGSYEFKDIALYVGSNDFRLMFYGPLGELRQEDRRVVVDPNQFERRKGYYALSATRQYITTWQDIKPVGPDVGSPHIAALYQYSLGNLGTGSIGGRIRKDNGENRLFIQTGYSTIIRDIILNANGGYDPKNLEYTSQWTARKNFGLNRTSLQVITNSEKYNPDNVANLNVTKYLGRLSMNGPLLVKEIGDFKNLNYGSQASFGKSYNGLTTYSAGTGISARYTNISVNTGLNFRGTSKIEDILDWSAGARGYYKGGVWSLRTSYSLLPERDMGPIVGEYTYDFNDKLSGKAGLSLNLNPYLVDTELALNWRPDKVTISPKVQFNNSNKLVMTVNANFGLAPEPYSGQYVMTGKSVAGLGGVSARVFLDKNGDGYMQEGEELLSDVEVRAKQSYRKVKSNERGIAFLGNLPQGIITDITIDANALPDATYMSLFEGVSVNPRPGIVSQVEFPIVISGELDGNAYVLYEAGTRSVGRNIALNLVAPDGRIEASAVTAYDGYYSFSNIRPGVYYLMIDPAKSDGKSYMVPQRIVFNPDGSTYYSNNLSLTKGYDVPFRFNSTYKRTIPYNRSRAEKIDDIAGAETQLRLGPYHSKLGLTFAWYKFKLKSMPWNNYFELATPLAAVMEDDQGRMYLDVKAKRALSLNEAALACQNLIEMKLDCGVDVTTRYEFSKLENPTANAAPATKGKI